MTMLTPLTSSALVLHSAQETATAAQNAFSINIRALFLAGVSVRELADAVVPYASISQVVLALTTQATAPFSELATIIPADDGSGLTEDELKAMTVVPLYMLIATQNAHFVMRGTELRYRLEPEFLLHTDPPRMP